MQGFISTLLREITLNGEKLNSHSKKFKPHKIKSIYLGGGTPSLLPINYVEDIFNLITRYWNIDTKTEITFEINPGTIDSEYLSGLKAIGINRLSIGAQSFDEKRLVLLGRIHDQAQTKETITTAGKMGFENICADIIYGVDSGTDSIWQKDLNQAIKLPLNHLSCYMLTLEPGTGLYSKWEKNPHIFASSDEKNHAFENISYFLQDHGFIHYEISNFAKANDKFSIHNTGYWDGSAYIGFGPSAHSFFITEDKNQIRYWNVRDIKKYISYNYDLDKIMEESEVLTKEQQIMERIMLGLRTQKGIDLTTFYADFGIRFKTGFEDLIKEIESQGLGKKITKKTSQNSKEYFHLNTKGWTCLDHIVELFSLLE